MSWQQTREKTLDRDGNACRFCGMTNSEHKEQHDTGLHAHHIVPKSDGGEDTPDNLITVCCSCHRTLESTHANAISQLRNSEFQGRRGWFSDYWQSEDDMRDSIEGLSAAWCSLDAELNELYDILWSYAERHPRWTAEMNLGPKQFEGSNHLPDLPKLWRPFPSEYHSYDDDGPQVRSERDFLVAVGYYHGIRHAFINFDGFGLNDVGDNS